MLSSCNAEEDEAANMLSTSCSIDVKKKKKWIEQEQHASFKGFCILLCELLWIKLLMKMVDHCVIMKKDRIFTINFDALGYKRDRTSSNDYIFSSHYVAWRIKFPISHLVWALDESIIKSIGTHQNPKSHHHSTSLKKIYFVDQVREFCLWFWRSRVTES
jgi:hypothetical protein